MHSSDEAAQIREIRYQLSAIAFETKAIAFYLRLKAGFRPDQPRVPAGNLDGGQWTVEGLVQPVSRRGPRGGQVRIQGRWLTVSPAQEARLAVSAGQAREALRAVRRVDPNWRPTPQAYQTVEGLIRSNEAIAAQARFRVFELRGTRVGPGPFAKEWFPAPPTNRRLNRAEQAQVDRLGRLFGCHWCGIKESGTPRGSFIGDHQIPKSLGRPTRIYPHCLKCSLSQGGLIKPYLE